MTDTQADGITIQPKLNLPPDGTYPPRILTPTTTIWLCEGTIIDIDDGLSVFNRKGECYIKQDESCKKVRLNGVPFNGEYLLKDGDFVKFGQGRIMFQADPVANYRQAIQDGYYEPQIFRNPIHLSANMAKNVVINYEGISLNSGKDFVLWKNLKQIQIETYESVNNPRLPHEIGKYHIIIHHYCPQTRYKYPPLYILIDINDLDVFANLLQNSMPYIPSGDAFADEFDAYFSFIHSKLLVPHEVYKVPLPEAVEFLYDKHSYPSNLFNIVFLYFMINLACSVSAFNYLLPIVMIGSTSIFLIPIHTYLRNRSIIRRSIIPRFDNRKKKKLID